MSRKKIKMKLPYVPRIPDSDEASMYWFPYGALRQLAADVISEFYGLIEALQQMGTPDPLPVRSVWTWSIVLGTLACDLADSGIRSIDAGDLRVAMLVNRSLYEYSNRLRYFHGNRERAIQYSREGVNFYNRMVEIVVSDYVSDLPELKPENKMKHQSISEMVNDCLKMSGALCSQSPARYKRHFHDGFYAAASALAHGSQGAIMDAFWIVEPGVRQTMVWMKRRNGNLKPPAMCTMTLMLILMMLEIEEYNMLPQRPNRWQQLMKRYEEFDKPLLAFKAAHAEQVGDFQMALDTLGT